METNVNMVSKLQQASLSRSPRAGCQTLKKSSTCFGKDVVDEEDIAVGGKVVCTA